MSCGPPPGMYAIFARHVRHLPQTCAPSLPDTEPIPTAHKKSDGPPPGDPSLDVPLNDEILNLWNDFRLIVEYLQSVEGITKLINSI